MEIFTSSDPESPRAVGGRCLHNAAFSLVEVALALGIMAFALVSVFGLMPIGMNSFRQTVDLSVGSQIAQQVIDEAQQADFNTLTGVKDTTTEVAASQVSKPIRYFDNQGTELFATGSTGLTGTVYEVNTRVVSATSLPSSAGASGYTNKSVATVTVQVVNNPGRVTIPLTNGLWTSSSTRPVTTFSTYVARSSSVPTS